VEWDVQLRSLAYSLIKEKVYYEFVTYLEVFTWLKVGGQLKFVVRSVRLQCFLFYDASDGVDVSIRFAIGYSSAVIVYLLCINETGLVVEPA